MCVADNVTNGDLLVRVSKNDARDSQGVLVKLARLRLRFAPPLISGDGSTFQVQALHLDNATVTIKSGGYTVDVWVAATTNTLYIDARHDSLHMEFGGFAVSATLESWRTEAQLIDPRCNRDTNGPMQCQRTDDVLLPKTLGEAPLGNHYLNSSTVTYFRNNVSSTPGGKLHRYSGGMLRGLEMTRVAVDMLHGRFATYIPLSTGIILARAAL
jgi:hypothetical protein